MPRKSRAIDDELIKKCHKELKELGVRSEVGRRIQAIISAKTHGITQVCKIFNISRDTMMRWIKSFKEEGASSFAIKPGRGRKNRLSDKQLEKLERFISENGSTLSSQQVRDYIKEEFGINYSISSAHRIMRNLNFSYITPRPSHYKKDPDKQTEFKKKSSKNTKKQPKS